MDTRDLIQQLSRMTYWKLTAALTISAALVAEGTRG